MLFDFLLYLGTRAAQYAYTIALGLVSAHAVNEIFFVGTTSERELILWGSMSVLLLGACFHTIASKLYQKIVVTKLYNLSSQ